MHTDRLHIERAPEDIDNRGQHHRDQTAVSQREAEVGLPQGNGAI
jgi:hypothetical protein